MASAVEAAKPAKMLASRVAVLPLGVAQIFPGHSAAMHLAISYADAVDL